MQNGYFYLDLDYVKRGQPWQSKSGRRGNDGHTVAHNNYILRDSARNDVIAVNAPTNKHQLKRFARAYDLHAKAEPLTPKEHIDLHGSNRRKGLIHELPEGLQKNLRKDARLFYKVQIAFPIQMTHAHKREAAQRFAWELSGKGQSVVWIALHDLDSNNPHGHCCAIDRHVETGKSVALISEKESVRRQKGLIPNSTDWVRALWEFECNSVLAEHGYDLRIDRRTNLERGLDAPGVHKGPLRTNTLIEPESEQAHPGEPLEAPMENISTQDWIAGALELKRNLDWLQGTVERIDRLTAEAQVAHDRAEKHLKEATAHDLTADKHRNLSDLANDNLQPLLRPDGSYKGFKLKLWKWEYASRSYRQAEALEQERHYQDCMRKDARELSDNELAESKRQAEMATTLTEKAQATKRELEDTVSTYGDKGTIEETLSIINDGISENLSHVTADEVYALYENGALTADQAEGALRLMGEHDYLPRIELRDRQELEQEGLEPF